MYIVIEGIKIHTAEEWAQSADVNCWAWEKMLSKFTLNKNDKTFLFPGHCQACNLEVEFILDDMYANGLDLNYRERMVCPKCHLNNRQRAIIGLMNEYMEQIDNPNIYMYEQITQSYKYYKNIGVNVIGSEYLGEEYHSGDIDSNGIRHEDAMKLSFNDETFHIILSQDVFEHVADIEKSLSESYRILKPNGYMIVSVPFYFNKEKTERRAEIVDGKICYLKEPQYHGNPIDPTRGSLVFYDYGWDLLEMIKKAGYKDAYFRRIYSVQNGNIGNNLAFLIAEK